MAQTTLNSRIKLITVIATTILLVVKDLFSNIKDIVEGLFSFASILFPILIWRFMINLFSSEPSEENSTDRRIN